MQLYCLNFLHFLTENVIVKESFLSVSCICAIMHVSFMSAFHAKKNYISSLFVGQRHYYAIPELELQT